MAVREKGHTWYVDFMLAKQRVREFGFTDPSEARAWELEARAAIERGKPLPPGPSAARPAPRSKALSNIQELHAHVVKIRWASMRSDKSERNSLQFVQWVGPLVSVKEALAPVTIHDFVEHLQDEHQSSSGTINRKLASISRLAKTARSLSLIDSIPELPWQKEGQGRIRWFTPEEEAQILRLLALWGEEEERDLFIFLADTGARLGEAFKLRWPDIARGDRSATFWETKAGNSRTVPLTERARQAVARRRADRTTAAGPFSEVNRWALRSLWLRLRSNLPFLESAVIHTYRHTCASRLVQNGVDITRVKTWMGHKAIQTTLRYAHLAPKHLDDVLRALEEVPV